MSVTTHTEEHDTPAGQFQVGRQKTGGRVPGSRNKKNTIWETAVTYEDRIEIIQTLVSLALSGDVGAAKEILNRLYGKAALAVDLTVTEGPKLIRAPFSGPASLVMPGGEWHLGDDYAQAEEAKAQWEREHPELASQVHEIIDAEEAQDVVDVEADI